MAQGTVFLKPGHLSISIGCLLSLSRRSFSVCFQTKCGSKENVNSIWIYHGVVTANRDLRPPHPALHAHFHDRPSVSNSTLNLALALLRSRLSRPPFQIMSRRTGGQKVHDTLTRARTTELETQTNNLGHACLRLLSMRARGPTLNRAAFEYDPNIDTVRLENERC